MVAVETSSHTPSKKQDPSAHSVARVYALAMLEAAAKDGNVDGILEELRSFLDDVLAAHPQFGQLMLGGMTSVEEKLRLIDKVVAPRSSPLLLGTLKTLAHHGRLELVRAVYDVAVHEQEQRAGKVRVQVTSAVPLNESLQASLRERLTQSLAAEPILELAVDPQLLGGLVVRVGDTVYDGSLKSRLRQLRGKLRERCLNEVQRGRDRFSHSAGN